MKLWEALKALDEGNEVEYKPDCLNWDEAQPFTDTKRLSTVYEMNRFDFRVKRKPLECWANVYEDDSTYYNTREGADAAASPSRIRCVKLCEVIE